MIIGITGKKQSGKDTIAKIIQYLYTKRIMTLGTNDTANEFSQFLSSNYKPVGTEFYIKRFADKLKDIVCLLTGCTRVQLEDEDFKNSKLPTEWIRYGYADGFIKKYIGDAKMGEPIMTHKECDKETYEEHYRTNWQTTYKHEYTYREVLQYIGTDLLRNQFHANTFVNSTMVDYKLKNVVEAEDKVASDGGYYTYPGYKGTYPNWIIPDVRFLNEVEAIKDRNGIIIKINRINSISQDKHSFVNKQTSIHLSETALDNYNEFDFIINNEGNIHELIQKVKQILISLKII